MFSGLYPSMRLGSRDSATFSTLSRGTSIGLAIDTEAGLHSIIAALVVLGIISCKLYNNKRREILKAMDILVFNLFVAEVFQGLGHALEMKWVIEGTVRTGVFCSIQGAFQQLGELSVALATLAIAVQTFLSVWKHEAPGRRAAVMVVGAQFVFVLLFVAIGFGVHSRAPTKYYATPTPYWCWIGDGFIAERIAGEYAWFWLTLLVSIALYIPIFLWYLGLIKDNRNGFYAPKHPRPGKPSSTREGKELKTTRMPSIAIRPGLGQIDNTSPSEIHHINSACYPSGGFETNTSPTSTNDRFKDRTSEVDAGDNASPSGSPQMNILPISTDDHFKDQARVEAGDNMLSTETHHVTSASHPDGSSKANALQTTHDGLEDRKCDLEAGALKLEEPPELDDISENMWAAILYPIVYCVLILPVSAVRWMDFVQKHKHGKSQTHPVTTFIVAVIFTHSGVVNALLYLSTRGLIFFPKKGDDPHFKAPATNALNVPKS